MTMAFTVSKSKEFVILTSLGKAKNLPTASSYSFALTLVILNRMIDSESRSFLVVQNDGEFNNL